MAEIDVEIDDFANSVTHEPTGEVFPTRIVPWSKLTPAQKERLAKWRFDWSQESGIHSRQVMALLVEGYDTVQGLMSLELSKGYIMVHLVESAPHNVGQNKLFRGVPNNLFAFACGQSFALGFDGFVGLDAKTELIEHYRLMLGAERIGSSHRMVIGTQSAETLLTHYYLKESDQWPL